MACKCARRTDEFHGWACTVSGDGCMFYCPDSKTCAVVYQEGPDADKLDTILLHCKDCYAEFSADKAVPKLECPECHSKNLGWGNYQAPVVEREYSEDDFDDE
jgi:hypothetical protein